MPHGTKCFDVCSASTEGGTSLHCPTGIQSICYIKVETVAFTAQNTKIQCKYCFKVPYSAKKHKYNLKLLERTQNKGKNQKIGTFISKSLHNLIRMF